MSYELLVYTALYIKTDSPWGHKVRHNLAIEQQQSEREVDLWMYEKIFKLSNKYYFKSLSGRRL